MIFQDRVLARHLAVPERVEVAAPHLDPLAIAAGPGQGPFRHAGVGGIVGEMLAMAIVDIGKPLKSPGQGLAHILLAFGPRKPQGWLPLGISSTQSSAKKLMMRSRSCALKASQSLLEMLTDL